MKVRKGSGEEIPLVQGKEHWLSFAGAAVKRYPTPEARGGGREDQPQIQGAVAARAQEGLEELSQLKVRKGSGEEIPLAQGKEQRLCFAGAAMKRYPTPKVRETQVRW